MRVVPGRQSRALDWIRQLLAQDALDSPRPPLLVAVLPDSPQTRRSLQSLRASAEKL